MGATMAPPGGHYKFVDLRHQPPPIQRHLPIMIGGSGEKKTLTLEVALHIGDETRISPMNSVVAKIDDLLKGKEAEIMEV